jgi:tRNA-specific 2-thiouridylase
LADLVVVAMSGGVDSSVAAALLLEQGYNVIGITLNLWPESDSAEAESRHSACCSLDAVGDARQVADKLGIPHYTLNVRDLFDRTVIQNFLEEYQAGRTPNPCVRCNRYVKFEGLLAKARALGAQYLATGHYARIGRSADGRFSLHKALDPTKDQSYALCFLTQEQLAHTLFPLGESTKAEVREIAAHLGLATATKPESQEICFVPGDYGEYLRQRVPSTIRPGPIRDVNGELKGTHQGIAFYTVGQRKGLGIANGKPLYVVGIDPEENAVIVGDLEDVYSQGLIADDVNWVSLPEQDGQIEVNVRIRYRASDVPATAQLQPDGTMLVEFKDPQRAVTPGQTVVLYKDDAVVAGGTIRQAVGHRLSV